MSAQQICSLNRWTALCESFGFEANTPTYEALIAAHAEKHRAYHTLDHIAACLKHLDRVRDLTEKADEIELALWFHDAIYQPFSATNEEDSANWAAEWLASQGAPPSLVAQITKYILDTKTHKSPESLDGQYLLDIDLSILGAPPEIYDRYEVNIRREYRRVPKFIFRKKRKTVLRSFLEKDSVYFTNYFETRLGMQAKANLARAMSNL